MLLILVAPIIACVSVAMTFFLSDRSRWRRGLLIVGILAAAASALQAYKNREQAEGLRHQVAQLNAVVAGRHLTPEAVQKISEGLKIFVGKHLFISSYTGDAEAINLGLQIKSALEGAHIRVDNNLGRTSAGQGGVGFGIYISGPEADTDFMVAMRKLLQEHGKIEVSETFLAPRVSVNDNVIGIMVALRPLSDTAGPKRSGAQSGSP